MKLKRLLALLGSLVIATSASASLVACGTTNKKTTDENPTLQTVVTKTDLGIFDHNDVTSDEILTRVVKENPGLLVDEVTLSKPIKIGQTYQVYLSVIPTSRSYPQGSILLTYEIQLPDLRIEVSQVVKNLTIGNFDQVPDADTVWTRILKLNPDLKQSELTLKLIGDKSFEITVNEGSTVYKPATLNGSFKVGTNQEILNQLVPQLEVLMLAQKFGFSQAELVKMLGVDQKAFANFFEPKSLKALTTDKKFNQTLGEPGALISLLFGNMIKVTSPIATKLLNGVLGTHLTGDEYSAAEITKAIEFYMHYLTPFLKEINFANVVQEIGAILPKVKLGTDQVQNISNSVDGFVKGQINQNYIQPIVKGIITGVDLSRFANKTLDVMMAQMSNQIINALGYALRDNYKPIIALNDDVSSAASTLKEMITNKEFKNFKFNRNTEKFIESVTSVVAMLNHVLTIFKTPKASFSVKEPQLHLFDDAKTNDEFAEDIYKKDMQTLVGQEALKGLNINELISNLLYFVGGNNNNAQYRLQKLMYALFYQGNKISSLTNFGVSTGINIALGKHSWAQDIIEIVGGINSKVGRVVNSFVNDQPLPFKAFFKTRLWKGVGWLELGGIKSILNVSASGLGDKVQEAGTLIEDQLGSHPFTTIYQGNLRPILNGLVKIVEDNKVKVQKAIETIDGLIGKDTPLNIKTFREKTLEELLHMFKVPGYENLEVPRIQSYYTSKNLEQLLQELETLLGVKGTDTHEQLAAKAIDLQQLANVVGDLLVVHEGEDETLLQKVVRQLKTPQEALKTLGFKDPDAHIIYRDSFFGRLTSLFIPKLATSEEPEILLDDYYDAPDTIMAFIVNLEPVIKQLLAPEKIDGFVELVKTKNAMKASQTDLVYFNDITQEIKSGTMTIEFDPSLVEFKDGSKMIGEIQKLTIKFGRDSLKDKFSFTQLN